MPLFARRTLQRLLTENSDLLTPGHRKAFATAFNSDRIDSLGKQWELVVLGAFRKIGRVEYEPNLGGRSSLDLLFRPDGSAEESCIEVTAVSDKELVEQNPYDDFSDEFVRRIRKAGLRPAGFNTEIGARLEGEGRKQRVALSLPRRGDFHTFFDRDFTCFLAQISRSPHEQHVFTRADQQVNVTITYQPGDDYMTGSLPGWNVDSFPTQTSAYRRLEEKATQIRRSGFVGPCGIVLCDAGAPVFRQSKSGYRVTPQTLVEGFLAGVPEVSFVVVLSTEIGNHTYRGCPPAMELIYNKAATHPCGPNLQAALETLRECLPNLVIESSAARRLLRLLKGREGLTHYVLELGTLSRSSEGYEMIRVRVSARELVQLLGGQLPLESFRRTQGLDSGNSFADACRLGDRLISVQLIHTPDDDDDWLEFLFEGKDPAWHKIS